MIVQGTRTRQNQLTITPPTGSMTKGFTRDVGLSKLVSGVSLTFGSGRVTAANGTFAAFAGGELILVENTTANNGYFDVTGIDTTNHAYLVLSPAPKSETITGTLRTA